MAPKKENISETRKKIHSLYEENELADLQQRNNRARSITIGTANGGMIEVGMRGDYSSLWYVLRPVEAAEILEQLAAAAGLEIAIRPKQNFASWRSWDSEMPVFAEWKGSAPHNIGPDQKEVLIAYETKQIKAILEAKEIKKLQESKNEPE
jgi:hypothetical protein